MNLPCKQAIIMTAYNDFPFILKNISRMTEYFDVFIHIDKRSKVPSEFYNQIERFPNVHVISKHKVLWGSYKHPEAILDLLSIAKECGPYSYYHIISANTMCAESYEKTYSFYQKEYENGWHNFLELAEIEKSQQKEYLLSRQNGWYFLHRYNSKPVNLFERLNKFFWNRIENVLTAVRFPKKLQFEYRYKGYVYSHLSGPFVTWLFENLDGIVLPALKEIKHFWVGEEFFFRCS